MLTLLTVLKPTLNIHDEQVKLIIFGLVITKYRAFHIGFYPSFSAKIRTLYFINLVFSAIQFLD